MARLSDGAGNEHGGFVELKDKKKCLGRFAAREGEREREREMGLGFRVSG